MNGQQKKQLNEYGKKIKNMADQIKSLIRENEGLKTELGQKVYDITNLHRRANDFADAASVLAEELGKAYAAISEYTAEPKANHGQAKPWYRRIFSFGRN